MLSSYLGCLKILSASPLQVETIFGDPLIDSASTIPNGVARRKWLDFASKWLFRLLVSHRSYIAPGQGVSFAPSYSLYNSRLQGDRY